MNVRALVDTRASRVGVVGAVVAILASFVLLAGPLAQPASAAVIFVDTPGELAAAVTAANSASEATTIELEGDIDLAPGDADLEFTGEWDVTIEGVSHSLTCSGGECPRLFDVELINSSTFSIYDITIDGFDQALSIYNTDLYVAGTTFSNNGWTTTVNDEERSGGAVYVGNSGGAQAVFENVDFVDNFITAGGGDLGGGALFVSGYVEISGSTFEGNRITVTNPASSGDACGGALCIFDGYGDITNTDFIDNAILSDPSDELYAQGGAIGLRYAGLEILGGLLEDNGLTNGDGGAIGAVTADVDIEDGEYRNNNADRGGAVYLEEVEEPWIGDDVIFADNEANSSGGAIYVDDPGGSEWGSFVLDQATFSGNSAPTGEGGAVYVTDGTAAIHASLFDGNESVHGGALFVYDAGVWVSNSTFAGNTAGAGAAVLAANGYISLTHATVADNAIDATMAPEIEAEAQVATGHFGQVDLEATAIVEPGSDIANCDTYGESDIDSDGYNFADDLSCGLDEAGDEQGFDLDAELGPLQWNGGPSDTMMPDPFSPLVDAIEWCEDVEEFDEEEYWLYGEDQRGVERPQEGACDIGAVENFEFLFGTLETEGGQLQIGIANSVGAEEPVVFPTASLTPAPPAGVMFPHGALGLEIEVWEPGWPVEVWLATQSPTNELWKLLDGEWQEYPGVFTVDDGIYIWKFRLVDGADGDSDDDDNGVIVDPVAVGIGAAFTG